MSLSSYPFEFEIVDSAEQSEGYVHVKENICEPDGPAIALCTLAAIPWKSKNKHDFEKPARILVRALDNLLTDQEYPILAAEFATQTRRPLGIGITNFAYWLAKNDTNYTEPNLELIDEFVEAYSYYLIKASADLAKERGSCIGFEDTKYSQGLLPIHTYKKTVDELVSYNPKMDWDGLTKQILTTGIRNSTLMAGMPCETSSAITNSTNGMEPVRSLITVKIDKDAKIKQVVPEIRKIKNKYELLWSQKNPKGYLKIMAVIQKYFDQALSVNTTYCPPFYDNNEIPESELIEDLVQFYKYGGKNLYYFNTYIPDAEEQIEDCEACKV